MEKEVKAAEANYDKAAEAAQEIDSQVTRQRSRIHDNPMYDCTNISMFFTYSHLYRLKHVTPR